MSSISGEKCLYNEYLCPQLRRRNEKINELKKENKKLNPLKLINRFIDLLPPDASNQIENIEDFKTKLLEGKAQ